MNAQPTRYATLQCRGAGCGLLKTGLFTLFGDRWLCVSCTERKRALKAPPVRQPAAPPDAAPTGLISEPAEPRRVSARPSAVEACGPHAAIASSRPPPPLPSTWGPRLVGERGFERSPAPPVTFTIIDDPEAAPVVVQADGLAADLLASFPTRPLPAATPGLLDDVVRQPPIVLTPGVESPFAELAAGEADQWRDAPEEKAARLALLGVKELAAALRAGLDGLDVRIGDLEAALARRPRRRKRIPKVGARQIVNAGAVERVLAVFRALPPGSPRAVADVAVASGLKGKLVSEMCSYLRRKGRLQRRPLASWRGRGRGCFEYWLPGSGVWEPSVVERLDLDHGTVFVVVCDAGFDRKVGSLLRAFGATWEVLGWDDHRTVGAPVDGERIAVRVRYATLTAEAAPADDAPKAAAGSQEAEV